MMKKYILSILIYGSLTTLVFAQDKMQEPNFEEVMSLPSASGANISPDGRHVLFTVNQPDWEANRFDREIWISKDGEPAFQLTNNLKASSQNPKWSPDTKWIAYVTNKAKKSQIFAIRVVGGEAFQVSQVKGNIGNFEWSPDGKKIAFTMRDAEPKEQKSVEKKYGKFAIEDQAHGYRNAKLWVIDFNPESFTRAQALPCKEGCTSTHTKLLYDNFDQHISNFAWSPDGKKMAIQHQPNPFINTFIKSEISILDVSSKELTPLVNNPSADGLVAWSPDGKSILYESDVADSTSNYYKNARYFRINLDGSNQKELAKDFDENLYRMVWVEKGVYGLSNQKTDRGIFMLNPDNGQVSPVPLPSARIFTFSVSADGAKMAYTGQNDNTLSEVFQVDTNAPKNPKALTNFSTLIKDWKVAQSEVVSWKSEDGAGIEGVLYKPMDYEPNKKYPLLVVIHGGPTGVSRPNPVPAYVYPIVQWLNKGALVLSPNYRGSAGYGEAFRSLNVKNLGVGDAWDVMSGIDYLAQAGRIDTSKMAAMGWSQGGYISAFLTTTTKSFKAISVGAGISNWMTYYVNTDVHPFTRQYLKATPWQNAEIYAKTSPMTFINQAQTPTLIQHGEFDRRVPIPNAYELYQGLQDIGVDTRLIVYKGFGHGITKPKERLAALWHNWQWFGKYLWGEDIDIPTED